MAFAPGQFDNIDPALIDKDIASEVLDNGQNLLKSQLDSVDSLDGKLTTLLSQNATLATAALGAAASVFWGSVDAKWIPPPLAVGLVAGGLVWLAAAGAALWGLRARPWATPFFRPSKLIEPDILNASAPALSYLLMARRLEGAIDRNGLQLRALARDVYLVQIGLVAGVLAIFAAALLSVAKAIF